MGSFYHFLPASNLLSNSNQMMIFRLQIIIHHHAVYLQWLPIALKRKTKSFQKT